MTKDFFFSLTLCAISLTANAHKKATTTQVPLTLWYNQEAHAFEESLPIGNGKLGALVYGAATTRHNHRYRIARCRIQNLSCQQMASGWL